MTDRAELTDFYDNVFETYCAIGTQVGGSALLNRPRYRGVIGSVPHAVCNFLFAENLIPSDGLELRKLGEINSSLGVYAFRDRAGSAVDEILQHAGFTWAFYQDVFVHNPGAQGTDPALARLSSAQLQAVECAAGASNAGSSERELVVSFVVEQFFRYSSPEVRRVMFLAMMASNIPFTGFKIGNRLVGAVSLKVAGNCMGLYNLCVNESNRGQGIGGSIVQWCVAEAGAAGQRLTLQCSPKVSDWYRIRGFYQVARLDGFRNLG